MNFIAFFKRTLFWIDDFFHGSNILKPYNEIKYFENLPKDQAEFFQRKKLNAILTHATQFCDFYKQCNPQNLLSYPVVNKSILLKNYDKIAVPNNCIPEQKGKVHIQSTSGSTGTPFAVPQDTNKRFRRIAELKYFGKIVGFNSHDMLIHLRIWNKWQQKTPKQIKRERIIPFDIANMDNMNLKKLCDEIISNKAVCIRGYSSSINLLANYVRDNPQDFPNLKIIIAGSEALLDETRENTKKYLKCEIISQYADEECGILAQEKVPTQSADNVMYLNNAGYVFEFLKEDSDETANYGELARIVITDLHNYAFPIIRYDTGDVGVLMPPNQHSNGWPILSKLYGRRFDTCKTTSGKPFAPFVLSRILKHYQCFDQWQFIQKGKKNYQMKFIARNERDAKDSIESILDELRNYIGMDAIINIEFVKDIPVLASGKTKAVVNEWKN